MTRDPGCPRCTVQPPGYACPEHYTPPVSWQFDPDALRQDVVGHIVSLEHGEDGSIRASGGWCAPSETLYQIVDEAQYGIPPDCIRRWDGPEEPDPLPEGTEWQETREWGLTDRGWQDPWEDGQFFTEVAAVFTALQEAVREPPDVATEILR